MDIRLLGRTGLQVSALSFGTMTFGGRGRFGAIGSTGVEDARRQLEICLDAGVNLIDTADVYSEGLSEEILGEALGARRDRVVLATKVRGRMGEGPNDVGLSRHHIIQACEASLRRLRTDWIDLYQVHGWDSLTPLEETLGALDTLVASGKVRYIGCSNYSAWHLMKALSISERESLERFVVQQVHYSLVSRELEHELVPLSVDQGVGILVWSPLSGGFLSGKFRLGHSAPEDTRRATLGSPGSFDEAQGFRILEVVEEIARDHGASVPQVALNWLRAKPGVTSVIVGARTDEQLGDNLAAASWELSPDEVARLDEVSERPLPYPYWHQREFAADRMPEWTGAS
jgi:aryl-alcohol dehydrogenase-like predicted oxidoreductase